MMDPRDIRSEAEWQAYEAEQWERAGFPAHPPAPTEPPDDYTRAIIRRIGSLVTNLGDESKGKYI